MQGFGGGAGAPTTTTIASGEQLQQQVGDVGGIDMQEQDVAEDVDLDEDLDDFDPD